MAHLMLRPTIKAASTILGYETHVKYFFRENGCAKSLYKTPFLGQIRSGIENIYPATADKRCAFLLPEFTDRATFLTTKTKEDRLLKLAIVIGFVGMLRPHTFPQLGPKSF